MKITFNRCGLCGKIVDDDNYNKYQLEHIHEIFQKYHPDCWNEALQNISKVSEK